MIFRPSSITGTSNIKDFSNLLMRGTVDLGAYPSNLGSSNFVPVAFCARFIADISLSKFDAPQASPSSVSSDDGVYHLNNPHGNISFDSLFQAIISFGYKLEKLTLPEFKEKLSKRSDNVLFPLLNQFAGYHFRGDPFMPKTIQEMKKRGIVCPNADAKLIHEYLSTFVEVGLLSAPKAEKSLNSVSS